jgi:biopolymer transport protein ExbB/TolQ
VPRPGKFLTRLAACIMLCFTCLSLQGHEGLALAQPVTPPTTPAPAAAPAHAAVAPAPASPTPATAPAPVSVAPQAAPPPPAAPTVVKVSILGMVRKADPTVQGVMLFLVMCSAASWAAFFFKSVTLAIAKRNTERFHKMLQLGEATVTRAKTGLTNAPNGPARKMWQAACAEWDASLRVTPPPLAADQVNRLLQRQVLVMGSVEERALSRLGNWMGLLATIGSTSPFIGLFGTVWGIFDSFEHISASFNTSLTVVAPGIAEALLATAAGLFAAIPATMFYNRFAREIGKITGMLDNVTAEIVVLISRDAERLHK